MSSTRQTSFHEHMVAIVAALKAYYNTYSANPNNPLLVKGLIEDISQISVKNSNTNPPFPVLVVDFTSEVNGKAFTQFLHKECNIGSRTTVGSAKRAQKNTVGSTTTYSVYLQVDELVTLCTKIKYTLLPSPYTLVVGDTSDLKEKNADDTSDDESDKGISAKSNDSNEYEDDSDRDIDDDEIDDDDLPPEFSDDEIFACQQILTNCAIGRVWNNCNPDTYNDINLQTDGLNFYLGQLNNKDNRPARYLKRTNFKEGSVIVKLNMLDNTVNAGYVTGQGRKNKNNPDVFKPQVTDGEYTHTLKYPGTLIPADPLCVQFFNNYAFGLMWYTQTHYPPFQKWDSKKVGIKDEYCFGENTTSDKTIWLGNTSYSRDNHHPAIGFDAVRRKNNAAVLSQTSYQHNEILMYLPLGVVNCVYSTIDDMYNRLCTLFGMYHVKNYLKFTDDLPIFIFDNTNRSTRVTGIKRRPLTSNLIQQHIYKHRERLEDVKRLLKGIELNANLRRWMQDNDWKLLKLILESSLCHIRKSNPLYKDLRKLFVKMDIKVDMAALHRAGLEKHAKKKKISQEPVSKHLSLVTGHYQNETLATLRAEMESVNSTTKSGAEDFKLAVIGFITNLRSEFNNGNSNAYLLNYLIEQEAYKHAYTFAGAIQRAYNYVMYGIKTVDKIVQETYKHPHPLVGVIQQAYNFVMHGTNTVDNKTNYISKRKLLIKMVDGLIYRKNRVYDPVFSSYLVSMLLQKNQIALCQNFIGNLLREPREPLLPLREVTNSIINLAKRLMEEPGENPQERSKQRANLYILKRLIYAKEYKIAMSFVLFHSEFELAIAHLDKNDHMELIHQIMNEDEDQCNSAEKINLCRALDYISRPGASHLIPLRTSTPEPNIENLLYIATDTAYALRNSLDSQKKWFELYFKSTGDTLLSPAGGMATLLYGLCTQDCAELASQTLVPLVGKSQDSLLHYSARIRATEVVKFILKSNNNILEINAENETPLSIAIAGRDTEILELLLAATDPSQRAKMQPGQSADKLDEMNCTLLDIALADTTPRPILTEWLLANKARWNRSISANSFTIIKTIIERLPDQLEEVNHFTKSLALCRLVEDWAHEDETPALLMRMIQSFKTFHELEFTAKNNPLRFAIKTKDVAMATALLERNHNSEISECFLMACTYGWIELAPFISLSKDNLSEECKDNALVILLNENNSEKMPITRSIIDCILAIKNWNTHFHNPEAILTAIQQCHDAETIDIIYKYPAVVDFLVRHQREICKAAWVNNNIYVIKKTKVAALKANDVKTIDIDDSENSPLLLAVADRDEELATELLRHFNIHAKNNAQISPLWLAVQNKMFTLVERMLTDGNNTVTVMRLPDNNKFIDEYLRKHKFPLHGALFTDNLHLFAWLCANDVDASARDEYNNTVMELAIGRKLYSFAEAIIDYGLKSLPLEQQYAAIIDLIKAQQYLLAQKLLYAVGNLKDAIIYVNTNGETALSVAIQHQAYSLAETMLDKAGDFCRADDLTSLARASLEAKQFSLARKTMQHKFTVTYAQGSSNSLLHAMLENVSSPDELSTMCNRTATIINTDGSRITGVGALVLAINQQGLTAVDVIISRCNIDLIEPLIPHIIRYCDINTISRYVNELIKQGTYAQAERILRLNKRFNLGATIRPITGSTLLHELILNPPVNSHVLIDLICTQTDDINQTNNVGQTAFMTAMLHKNYELVQCFIKHHDKISPQELGRALVLAIIRHAHSIIQSLIGLPSIPTQLLEDALIAAAIHGNDSAVSQLLSRADYRYVNTTTDDDQNSALHHLLRHNPQRMPSLAGSIKLMLREHPSLSIKNKAGETPIRIAMANEHITDEIWSALITEGKHLDKTTAGELLVGLCQANKFNLAIESVSRTKTDMSMIDEHGNTALHLLFTLNPTAHKYCEQLVLLLLRKRAPLYKKNTAGSTPIDVLMHNPHLAEDFIVNIIIEIDAANCKNSTIEQWLISLCRDRKYAAAAILLSKFKTSNIDATNKDGYTALHYAVAHHQVEIARTLCERGANVCAVFLKNLSPLDTALNLSLRKTTARNTLMVRTLVSNSRWPENFINNALAKSYIKEFGGPELLAYALRRKDMNTIRWLCLNDVNPDEIYKRKGNQTCAWRIALDLAKQDPAYITGVKALLEFNQAQTKPEHLAEAGELLSKDASISVSEFFKTVNTSVPANISACMQYIYSSLQKLVSCEEVLKLKSDIQAVSNIFQSHTWLVNKLVKNRLVELLKNANIRSHVDADQVLKKQVDAYLGTSTGLLPIETASTKIVSLFRKAQDPKTPAAVSDELTAKANELLQKQQAKTINSLGFMPK